MLARERLRHVSELRRWGLDWQPADTWHLTSQLRVDYAVPWLPWLAWCAAIYRLRHTGCVPAKKKGWLYEAPVAVACKPQDQWPWRTESVRHGQCTVTARACRPCARLVATDASHLQRDWRWLSRLQAGEGHPVSEPCMASRVRDSSGDGHGAMAAYQPHGHVRSCRSLGSDQRDIKFAGYRTALMLLFFFQQLTLEATHVCTAYTNFTYYVYRN